MKLAVLITVLAGLCVAHALAPAHQEQSNLQETSQDALLQQFQAWAVQHNKPYVHDRKESARRFSIWASNVAHISRSNAQRNAAGSSTRLGLTAFTDLTREEFAAAYVGSPMVSRNLLPEQQQQQHASGAGRLPGASALLRRFAAAPGSSAAANKKVQHWRYENVTPPSAADWRAAQPPILGPIKDQHVGGAPCGSCWAFSAVSIMEIASAKATGKVISGSEQHLIDCDRKYDHGCEGGGWLNAIQYTIKNRGLATEDEYPYTAKDGKCNKTLAHAKHELQVDDWEDVPFSNETALAAAVSQTPVIVAICCGPAIDDWHHYTGGIFDSPCCEKDKEITLDHGMVVVGYGQEAGTPYWILKNSWGAAWGEQGFMRIRRNHGKHGKCALASYPAMVFRNPPQPSA
ncbi:hypothetical protein OEZ86_001758 [Tetradesmus obliquus]|nr:hypothetical protein OEZ86_001758 [Tetradesmus obliquus]